MGARYLTDLADVIRAAGLVVIEVGASPSTTGDAWKSRARKSGGYDAPRPTHVMVHHTASGPSSDGWPDVNYQCFSSGNDAKPTANLYLARAGTVYVMAAGATNTNGTGHDSWGGGVPDDSMNTHAIGIEAGNDGVGEPWPEAQQTAYVTLCNALAAAYGIDPHFHRGHLEWAPGRKIDPAGPSRWAPGGGSWPMDGYRADLGNDLPPPIPPLEDDVFYGPYLIQSTGASGDTPGTVYACDGRYMTLRRFRSEAALAGYRWNIRQAGAVAPELADGAPIIAVGDIYAFGEVIN